MWQFWAMLGPLSSSFRNFNKKFQQNSGWWKLLSFHLDLDSVKSTSVIHVRRTVSFAVAATNWGVYFCAYCRTTKRIFKRWDSPLSDQFTISIRHHCDSLSSLSCGDTVSSIESTFVTWNWSQEMHLFPWLFSPFQMRYTLADIEIQSNNSLYASMPLIDGKV